MSVDASQTRSRRTFLLLAVLFFAPLAAAFILYYAGGSSMRPAGRTNKGELIEPPRPLPNTVLLSADDQQLDAEFLRGKWTLAYIGDGQCDVRCREALTLTRQTRLALAKEMDRVQRVFFVTSGCCDQPYLRGEQKGLITARLDEASDQQFLTLFPAPAGTPVSQAGRIYIIDPLGNLMMSYAPSAPPKGLLEDLKKLLKLSHIG